MSKHTPGPWSVVDGHYPSMQEIQGPSFKINIVMSATDLNFQDYLSRSADARLIAAAPELLEALSNLLSVYAKPDELICCSGHECGCMGASVYEQAEHYARAAIAKALGEE